MITNEAIERRIACLELRDNDYFHAGMQEAVAQAEASGAVMTPVDANTYASQNTTQVCVSRQE